MDSAVADYFDREAPGWDLKYDTSVLFRRRRAAIAAALAAHAPRGGVGLDFGCGSGALTDLLRDRTERTVATDVSAGMLARTRERFEDDDRVVVVEPDAVEHAAHDVVLCSSVIEYALDDDAFLARLASFAHVGGTVVISFPHRWGPLQLLNRWILSPWQPDSYVHRQRNVYSVSSARERLLRHGLEPLVAKASIGLPVLGALGLGELILAVARKRS